MEVLSRIIGATPGGDLRNYNTSEAEEQQEDEEEKHQIVSNLNSNRGSFLHKKGSGDAGSSNNNSFDYNRFLH
jgi:hypothetical protein